MHSNVSSLINDQINNELYSSYVYLDIANYYESKGLDGFANWFEIQAKEELDHALLLYKYLQNNGQKVTFEAIKKPECKFDDNMSPLQEALRHEKFITACINNIYAAANSDNDYRTMQLLDWFVNEQGEEEKNASDLVTKMELFGDDSRALYMLNSELKARAYSPASLEI